MVLSVKAIYNKITNYRGEIMKKIKGESEDRLKIYVNGIQCCSKVNFYPKSLEIELRCLEIR